MSNVNEKAVELALRPEAGVKFTLGAAGIGLGIALFVENPIVAVALMTIVFPPLVVRLPYEPPRPPKRARWSERLIYERAVVA